MNWRNTADGYGLVQIALHWTLAAMIAVLLPLGLWMTGLDYYDPWYNEAPDIHRSVGVLSALVLAARLLVRLTQPQPRPLGGARWELAAARCAHALLYLLPLLLVVSGYLISTADGRPVEVFGRFTVPASVHGIAGQAEVAGEVHYLLALVLLAVVAVHIAGALRHHMLDHDDTLQRMFKPSTKTAEEKETR